MGTNSVGWIRPGVVVGQSRVSLARPGAVGGKSGTSMGGWWELIFSRLDSSRGGGGHKLRVSLARPGVVGGH